MCGGKTMSENKALSFNDLKKAVGGSFNGRNAKVYSLDGPSFGIYDEPSTTAVPLFALPNGTELDVDPVMIEALDFFPGASFYVESDDFYWASYNYRVRSADR